MDDIEDVLSKRGWTNSLCFRSVLERAQTPTNICDISMEETLRELDQLFAQIEETNKRNDSLENAIGEIDGENMDRASKESNESHGTEPLTESKWRCGARRWLNYQKQKALRSRSLSAGAIK